MDGPPIKERIYLGGYELYREQKTNQGALETAFARTTLDLHDDHGRVALIENVVTGDDGSPKHVVRYQLTNHLGSSLIELDDRIQVLTYEEYHPYGTTAYQGHGTLPASKRYRYTGKERDEETGLAYHAARYYAPWLGRWASPDPAGMVNGPNTLVYVNGNPVRYIDEHGREPIDPRQKLLGEAQARVVSKNNPDVNALLSTPLKITNDLQRLQTFRDTKKQIRIEELQLQVETNARAKTEPGEPHATDGKVDAQGPHTVFRGNPDTGRIENYQTFDPEGLAGGNKRFRGTGKPHGGVDPPLIVEPRPGHPGGRPVRAQPARPEETPLGF